MAGEQGANESRRITVRAIQLADRIETGRLERIDLISDNPVAFAEGEGGFIVVFRFGVVVLFGLSPIEEERALSGLAAHVSRGRPGREEETIQIVLNAEREDAIIGGAIHLRGFSPERGLVIADALAKSVALASDERDVAQVIDDLEPFSRRLAETGRVPAKRGMMLQKIGAALLVRQRVVGRVAVEEKPDVLWDRPDLERLYARVEDEFELKERAGALKSKLEVIGESATALTDLLDTERSLRLEMAIVALIVFEILITFYQMWRGAAH